MSLTEKSFQKISASKRDIRFRYSFAVLLFFLSVVFPVHFFVGSLRFSADRLVLAVFLFPMIFNLVQGRYGKLLWVDFLFFGHFIWVAVCLIYNETAGIYEKVGSYGLEFFGGYLLGRTFIRDTESFTGAVLLFTILIISTLPFAVYEAFSGRAIILDFIRGIPGLSSVEPLTDDWYNRVRLGLYRSQVFAAHPIHYGLICASVFPLVLIGFRGLFSNFVRYLLVIFVLTGVFFSLSSGPLVSLTVHFSLIIWTWIFGKSTFMWKLLVVILSVAYIIAEVASDRSVLIILSSYLAFNPSTAYGRGIIFEFGMMNVWENPVFGLGFRDWYRLWWMQRSVDNFWLLSAMKYGIPGFLFLFFGFFSLFLHVAKRPFVGSTRLTFLRGSWLVMMCGLVVVLSTVHIWGTTYSLVMFLVGSGAWLIVSDSEADDSGLKGLDYQAGRGDIGFSRFSAKIR